jgi:cytosine/adenosine deaminase-related metal-dependent hydrolase
MDLGDGFLPVEKLEGIEVCVGSDSQVRIDPLAEVRALEWHARARLGRRNVLSPPGEGDGLALRLLDAGTRVGADALGVEAGDVTPGQWADLMGVEVSRFALGEAGLLASLVFSADARCVQDVWVGGRRIVTNGHHDDAVTIRANARAVLESLL